MQIIDIPAKDADRILPLLQDLHALHVLHQPDRYPPNPNNPALLQWLTIWMQSDGIHAIGAQDPSGALMGYAIYQIEERRNQPLLCGGKRIMLQHIAVAPTCRRKGVGSSLIEEIKARCQALEITTLVTTYATFNIASAVLMDRMGLLPVTTVAEWKMGV